jgi:hypothetical protein
MVLITVEAGTCFLNLKKETHTTATTRVALLYTPPVIQSTRTLSARCAPYPKQNDDHRRRHENITVQSVREQQIHSKIPNRAISVSHNVSVQSFKVLSVNIAEHKSFVNYIVSNTSRCSTQALNGSSSKQYA